MKHVTVLMALKSTQSFQNICYHVGIDIKEWKAYLCGHKWHRLIVCIRNPLGIRDILSISGFLSCSFFSWNVMFIELFFFQCSPSRTVNACLRVGHAYMHEQIL